MFKLLLFFKLSINVIIYSCKCMTLKFDFLKKSWVNFYHLMSFLEILTFLSSEDNLHPEIPLKLKRQGY